MNLPKGSKMLGEGIVAIPLTKEAHQPELTAQQRQYLDNLNLMTECASAVGNLCFAWSGLEQQIDVLISKILDLSDEALADTLLANIDLREKLKIVVGLGHLRRVSDEWFDVLKWCIDTIDFDLRVQRNRFVHDRWHVSHDGIKQIQKRTGFRKAQSFQNPTYYTELSRQIDAKEIESLNADIHRMIIRISVLRLAGTRKNDDWKTRLEGLAPLPPRPPK